MSVLRTELNTLCDSDCGSVGHLINKGGGGHTSSEISVACDENESALNSVSR